MPSLAPYCELKLATIQIGNGSMKLPKEKKGTNSQSTLTQKWDQMRFAKY
jgi:hypothetical protein